MSSKNGNGKKKNGNGKSFTKKVEAVLRKNEERKSRIYEYSSITCDPGGFTGGVNAVQDLTRLEQGTQVYERVGNNISPTYLQCRFQIVIGDGTNVVRCLVWQWNPDNDALAGIIPTVNSLLLETSVGIDQVYALYIRNMKNARILYDKTFTLDAVKNKQVVGKFNLNLVKKMTGTCTFDGTSVSGKGHLYMTFLSDSGFTVHPTVTLQAKLSYRDS